MRWVWVRRDPACAPCLSEEEKQRAADFSNSSAWASFVQARSTLRRHLGERLGCCPRRVRLRIGESGKPHTDGCEFNLSHSGDWIFLGVTDQIPIGVDVEEIRTRNIEAIAERFYAPGEIARLEAADYAPFVFAELWTAKESFLKALGQGITRPLAGFDVSKVNHEAWIDVEEVRVKNVWAPNGYAAAVALLNA